MAEKEVIVQRGPRFFMDGDMLMFENVIDSSNKVGPRIATETDRKQHAAALSVFKNPPATDDPEWYPNQADPRRRDPRRGDPADADTVRREADAVGSGPSTVEQDALKKRREGGREPMGATADNMAEWKDKQHPVKPSADVKPPVNPPKQK